MTTFYDAIYSWVKDNFGESEANDPSWNIEALAKHLSEQDINPDELNAMTKTACYRAVERAYLRDDCDMVAENMGVKLTDKELDAVVNEYMDSDAYADVHTEDWQWFIRQEIRRREEEND